MFITSFTFTLRNGRTIGDDVWTREDLWNHVKSRAMPSMTNSRYGGYFFQVRVKVQHLADAAAKMSSGVCQVAERGLLWNTLKYAVLETWNTSGCDGLHEAARRGKKKPQISVICRGLLLASHHWQQLPSHALTFCERFARASMLTFCSTFAIINIYIYKYIYICIIHRNW